MRTRRFYGGCQPGLELRFIACVESAFRQVSEMEGDESCARPRSAPATKQSCRDMGVPQASLWERGGGFTPLRIDAPPALPPTSILSLIDYALWQCDS